MKQEMGLVDNVYIQTALAQFFTNSQTKSSTRNFTEILSHFLDCNKELANLAEGFGVGEKKLQPFIELFWKSSLNQNEQLM